MCNTKNAFESCSIQISNALSNLVELSIDYCNDLIKLSDGFCNITTSKKVSIINCHKFSALPQDFEKSENLEVLRLCSCSDLVEMPKSVGGLKKLRRLDFQSYPTILVTCKSELPKLSNDIGGYLREHFPNFPNLKIDMPKVDISLNFLHGTHS
ncbi:unnamed protein product [Vicia faba]|uniref:Disease resistance protein n=1 Tax=Vicia faba TaxID=3906 RepID=A0AAV0YSZ4_VICFA|nr:unnamed protein product [Vicia faba]